MGLTFQIEGLPEWALKFPTYENSQMWRVTTAVPYLRLARGLKMQDLSPEELQAIIETWMDAKKRYEKEFGK